MIKSSEIADPNSCLNRAQDDEPIFVIRAHDIHGSNVVRQWALDRQRLIFSGVKPDSDRRFINEAFELADKMDAWRGAREAAGTSEPASASKDNTV